MFSFIKALQNFFSNLKKKKGLWFTTLTILSIIGISVSMYLLSNMTTSIAKEVYINMSSTYINNLEDKIEDKKNEFRKIILGLQTNDTFKNNLDNKLIIDSVLEYYNKNLSEDEVGYIALNLALALERQRKDINKKTVLLVCSSGKGSAELLAYTYKEAFGEYIEELITCSVYDLESMDFSKIDYVFTTVPINIKVPIPIQEVEYFLEESNIRDIKKIFTVEEKDNFLKYYDNDLFLSNICLKTKEEILKYMVNHIKKYKIIPNNFLSSIKKREKLGITEFGNKIAMPHPDKTLTEESFVCVGILENPIIWEKKEVQVVFLVSVSKKTDKKLKYFYKVTAKFLLNKKNIEKLIKSRKYEDLILMLKNIEEKMEDETNE